MVGEEVEGGEEGKATEKTFRHRPQPATNHLNTIIIF
jgi:hypothetical protein